MANVCLCKGISEEKIVEAVKGGACTKVCPLNAIEVFKGMYAKVNVNKCVGCGKCSNECPASVITINEAEVN